MKTAFLASVVLLAGLTGTAVLYAEPDEKVSKELKLLAGTWAEDPPKGDGRRNAFHFKEGKLAWQSTRHKDGELLIGHTKVYDILLDPTAKPKEITMTSSVPIKVAP